MRSIIFIHVLLLAIFALSLTASGQIRSEGYLTNGGSRALLKLRNVANLSSAEIERFKAEAVFKMYEVKDPDGLVHSEPIEGLDVRIVGFRDKDLVELSVSPKLPYGPTYLLKIDSRLQGRTFNIARFETSGEATMVATNRPREELLMVGKSAALSKQIAPIVTETVVNISDDKKFLDIDTVPIESIGNAHSINRLDVRMDKLSEGRTHRIKVAEVADDGKTVFQATTKIKVPGRPASDYVPWVDMKLSSDFGANEKPQFNLVGSFQKKFADSRYFYLEPQLKVDIGLGATKSNNSIILLIPTFKYDKTFAFKNFLGLSVTSNKTAGPCEMAVSKPVLRVAPGQHLDDDSSTTPEQKQELDKKLVSSNGARVALPCYYEWNHRSLFRLKSYQLTAGPKIEMNKRFGRVNAVGFARVDFNFDRLQHSVATQKSYLAVDLAGKPYEGLQDEIVLTTGFSITPRIGVDFGRKLTGDVQAFKSTRIVIEPFPILRTYAGFESAVDFMALGLPIRLSSYDDLFYLAKTETIGVGLTTSLDVRHVRGLQPHSKTSLDIFLSPAKRYSFSISYENGRSAPNWEYLNVISTGLRVFY